MQNTKDQCSNPSIFSEKKMLKLVFFVPNLVEVHKEMQNTKYQSSNPFIFSKEKF